AYITSIFPIEYIKHTNIAFILLGVGLLVLCCFHKNKSNDKNNILSLMNIVYFPLLFTGITYIL
ncbi:hypothetical protein, partial [Rodentibacter mrazii]|uniref:hypothetical protein n=1 Tax=Rodentibacter mrazii TaxID=1908257 RepID=UPI001ABF1551